MKKILIVDFTCFFGGGQKFAINLEYLFDDIFEFHFAVSSKQLFESLVTTNKIQLSTSLAKVYNDILAINSYVRINNIDTVILNGNRPIYFSMFFFNVYKIAYKHTGINAISNPFKKAFSLLLLNLNYFFVKKIVVLYYNASNEVILNKSKIEIIPNTIVFQHVSRNESLKNSEIINLVCVSRIEENKGIKFLLDTFLRTYNLFSINVCLNIFGDGPLLDEYISYYEKSNPLKVKFHGFTDNVNEILKSADVFILPSKFEAFPLSILEAMSVGLPIVSTNTGGIADMVIDGKNGFLVKYDDSISLSNHLIYLVDNKDERLKMGLNSLDYFNSRFSNKFFIEKFKKLIC